MNTQPSFSQDEQARLRLVKVSESNLLVSVEHQVWGAEADRLRSWQIGEYIGFLTSDGLAALAKVNGLAFESDLMIWEGALYPYRVSLEFFHNEDRWVLL